MRKIAGILILTAVAVFCATQIEADLTLSNGTIIRVTIPKGAFEGIDSQKEYISSDFNDSPSSPNNETNIPLMNCGFDNESELEQFRMLWDIDSPAPAQEQTDISTDMFVKSLLAANYLMIQGEYAKHFAKNMAKYGLLGAHSADIIASEIFSGRPVWSSGIFKDLFQAFLEQTGFNYRIVHLSTGKKMQMIEKNNAWPKKIDQAYTGVFQTEKRRTVLYSELGPTGSQEKRRNEAVLSWLLLNMGGSSIDIQYSMDISSEGFSELKKTIRKITKESEYGTHTYVEGLTLNVTQQNYTSLSTVLRFVPDLSRIELSMSSSSIPNAAVSSFARNITLCKFLKDLKITGKVLENAVVKRLVKHCPIIEKFSFSCKILEGRTIGKLRKCTRLKSLEVNGEYQPGVVVRSLVRHLSSLKKLSIVCEPLDSIAANSFQAWTRLETLKLEGESQPSAVVQELVRHLSSLKELSIVCEPLDIAAAESFEACPQLKKLKILGDLQLSAVVRSLARHLSSLKELSIVCEPLTPTAAESFQACSHLETLKLEGETQPSAVVQELVRHLSSLKELNIVCEPLTPTAAESFEACTQLKKLKISGESQPSAVVQELVRHLSSLKELNIVCEPLDIAAAESFEACTQLKKLKMFRAIQPNAVVQELLSHLSSLKELKIVIESANLALANTLQQCSNLRSLELKVWNYTPGFLAHYLQDPLLKLEYLHIWTFNSINERSEENNRAVKNAHTTVIWFSRN
ncbi:hypothetical protein NECID01_2147 [Nematocida sp. AWRm77]|nr:hypothetical protein NECID01_2147 [Nematocida sp. AWRm77]